MESFLPSEISRLVLGYLEEQKCDAAYDTFLATSANLEECLKMRKDGRKFRTQVMGLSLLDILYEYSAIYSLVQERLKKVDQETADSLKHSGSLLDKVTFLLNATGSGQTMLVSIRLPPGKSPQHSTIAHIRKPIKSGSYDRKRDYLRKTRSQFVDVPENIDQVQPSNLETTALSSLPGNSSLNHNISIDIEHIDDDVNRTPKRKHHQTSRRSRAGSVSPERNEDNLNLSVYQQALLDHELHEKIAENINKVIHTPDIVGNGSSAVQEPGSQSLALFDPSTSSCMPNNFTLELDNAIKTIVHQTESDPVFENFLQEVVGQETSDDTDDRGISDTSTPCKSTPETEKKQPAIKHRLRSAKRQSASPNEVLPSLQIECQNLEAIESIIAMNAEKATKETTIPEPIPQPEPTTVAQPTQHVLQPNSMPVEQPITIDTMSSSSSITNDIPVNSNTNLVMVGQQQQPTYVIADQFQQIYQQPSTSDNRFILLSNKLGGVGQQIVMQPQFQLSQPTMISEADILAMPLIMCTDDRQPSTYIVPQNVYSTVQHTTKRQRELPLLKPKCPKKVTMPKEKLSAYSVSTQETDTLKFTISVQAEPKTPAIVSDNNTQPAKQQQSAQQPDVQQKQQPILQEPTQEEPSQPTQEPEKPICSSSVPIIPVDSTKKDEAIADPKPVTPPVAQNKVLSLSSPRSSRSHVRALDFSTPPKENLSAKKALTSPTANAFKSPKSSAKKVRANLFTSPLKIPKVPIATRSPMVKLSGGWNKIHGAETITGVSSSPGKRRKEDIVSSTTDQTKGKTLRKRRTPVPKPKAKPQPKPRKSIDKPIAKRTKPEIVIKVGTAETPIRKTRAKNIDSWDEDLRALITPVVITKKAKPVKKTAKSKTLNTDDVSIEEALSQIEKSATKKALDNMNKAEETSQIEVTAKEEPAKQKERFSDEMKSKILKHVVEIVKTQETDKEPIIPVEGIRTVKQRFNKKCNVGVIPKKVITNQEESIPKIVTTININKKTDKVILSPSKMNANKRSLVEVEQKLDPIEVVIPEVQETNPLVEIKKVTPDLAKPSCSNVSSTTKRNLTPGLETPIKYDNLLYPITPRLYTPFSSTDSPFSRIFAENVGSVDLNLIPTPSLPITPQIVFTPNSQDSGSGYASRPTDYSNSSSYYQPSDSEQTQKLENILIEECKNLHSDNTNKNNESPNHSKVDYILNETTLPVSSNEPNDIGSITTEEVITIDTTTGQLASASIQNLSQSSIEQNSESDSSSCTSCDSESSTDESGKESNNTIIRNLKIKTPIKSKQLVSPEILDIAPKIKKLKFPKIAKSKAVNIIEYEHTDNYESPQTKSYVKEKHCQLLNELAEKRERVMVGLRKAPGRKPTKKNVIKRTRAPSRVTRSHASTKDTSIEDKSEQIDGNLADKTVEEPIAITRKMTNKPKTIESIAARLKGQSNLKKDDLKAKDNEPKVISKPISKIETEHRVDIVKTITEHEASKKNEPKSTKTAVIKAQSKKYIKKGTKSKIIDDPIVLKTQTKKINQSELATDDSKIKENKPDKIDSKIKENKIDPANVDAEVKSTNVDPKLIDSKPEKVDSKIKESKSVTVDSEIKESKSQKINSKVRKSKPTKVIENKHEKIDSKIKESKSVMVESKIVESKPEKVEATIKDCKFAKVVLKVIDSKSVTVDSKIKEKTAKNDLKIVENKPEKVDLKVKESKHEKVKSNKSEKVDSKIIIETEPPKVKEQTKKDKIKEDKSKMAKVLEPVKSKQKEQNKKECSKVKGTEIKKDPKLNKQNKPDSSEAKFNIALKPMLIITDCVNSACDKKNEAINIAPLCNVSEFVTDQNKDSITSILVNPITEIPTTSINIESKSPLYMQLGEEEEIARLHISSDDDEFSTTDISSQIKDPENLVKCLKERGIHLVANKPDVSIPETILESEPLLKLSSDEINNEELNIEITKTDETKKVQIKSLVVLDASKKINLDKIKLPQSTFTDTILGKKDKQIDSTSNQPVIENQSDDLGSTALSEDSEYNFDLKTISEDSPEFLKLNYETTETKCQKKLSDYNLEVLERTISAKVFVDEKEQEICLTITPFIELLSIPAVQKRRIKKLSNSSDSSGDNIELKIQKLETVKVKDSTVTEESLIIPPSSELLSVPAVQKRRIKKLSSSSDSSGDNIELKIQKLETDKIKDSTVVKEIMKNLPKCSGKVNITLEQYKNKCNKKNILSVTDVLQNKTEEVSRTEKQENVTDTSVSNEKETHMDNQEAILKKRKASFDSDAEQPNAKRALLRNLDLDIFLTKVHGPEDKS